ncbi:MAG: serine protease [Clostridia bacterium]|nr:serine protease [Clostridia bacterium]
MDYDRYTAQYDASGTPYPYMTSAEKAQKKKNPTGKKLIAFGVILTVVCLLVGGLSGAVSSFLMLRFFPRTEQTQTTEEENLFVPDLTPYTEAQETLAVEVPTAAAPETSADETTVPAAAQTGKTKGEIYAEAVNSIVGVTCKSTQTVQNFFGFGMSQPVTSSGSGFFWTADGYIVTNCHVVEGAEEIRVTLYDGTEYPATLTGADEANDIAVIKIEGSFTPVSVGSSSLLAVGDDVLVIGNALGELSYTFTDGVVSYLSRVVTTETGMPVRMFQTNAAINNGNSGGPVYNMDGKVVGIASAKYASSTVEGLGFCIPIDDVKDKIADLIAYGYVTGKPSLGVSLQSVTASVSMRYQIPQGCYVVAVGAGAAAEKAGVVSGDVITAADGTAVQSNTDLAAVLTQKKAGDSLSLTVYRGGNYMDLFLTLDEYRPAQARTTYSNVEDY